MTRTAMILATVVMFLVASTAFPAAVVVSWAVMVMWPVRIARAVRSMPAVYQRREGVHVEVFRRCGGAFSTRVRI